MSVKNIIEKWSGGYSRGDTAGRQFTVECTKADDGPVVAARAPGIPQWGAAHPKDPWLTADRPQATPISPTLFLVTVEYRRAGEAGKQPDPVSAPPSVHWGYVTCSEPIDQDLDAKPIANSAGQAFQPPPHIEVLDPLLSITRNEATDEPRQRLKYRMAVNSDPFYGAEPGQARMNGIEATRIESGKRIYWSKTYVIQFRDTPPKGKNIQSWWLRLMDLGRSRLVVGAPGGTMKRAPIVDQYGSPVTEPVMLDGRGQEQWGKAVAPVWLYFRTVKALPFSVFRLEY